VIFPFRFKDKKLRALGVNDTSSTEGRFLVRWILFLEEEIIEDREEVAKCLKTLRRELEKEFPALKTSVVQERIVYLSSISGDHPVPTRTLNILPDLIYLGAELRMEDAEESLRNLDMILNNCQHFETLLSF
jgi:hypothetical protein